MYCARRVLFLLASVRVPVSQSVCLFICLSGASFDDHECFGMRPSSVSEDRVTDRCLKNAASLVSSVIAMSSVVSLSLSLSLSVKIYVVVESCK